MILVWGIAFILAGMSDADRDTPSLIWWAFSIEKICYVFSWVRCMASHDLAGLFHDAKNSGDFKERPDGWPTALPHNRMPPAALNTANRLPSASPDRFFCTWYQQLTESALRLRSHLYPWQHLLVPIFYAIYGLIDFTFLLLFVHLGLQHRGSGKKQKKKN